MRLLVIGLSLIVVFAACGGGESAEDAVEELVSAFSASEYAEAYEMLHSDHQAVVPEDLFIECGEQAELGSTAVVDEFDVTGSRTETRTVPELGETKVTIVSVDLRQGTEVFSRTWEVVEEGGDWRWLLAEGPLNDYRAGNCP